MQIIIHPSSLGLEMLSIYVGPTRERFHIHQTLLSKATPVFASMFGDGFKETMEKSAELPDDDPQAFDCFLHWLYVGTIDMARSFQTSDLIKLYCFAEKYCINTLADVVIDRVRFMFIKDKFNYPSPECVVMAYENTSEGSRLRLYLARSIAHEIIVRKPVSLTQAELSLLAGISDFSRDIFALLLGLKEGQPKHPNEFPACEYHRHDNIYPCMTSFRAAVSDLEDTRAEFSAKIVKGKLQLLTLLTRLLIVKQLVGCSEKSDEAIIQEAHCWVEGLLAHKRSLRQFPLREYDVFQLTHLRMCVRGT